MFEDINGNGIKDPNEINLSGVSVMYLNASNQVISNEFGFLFHNDAGNYDFQIQMPPCYTITTPISINHNVVAGQLDTLYFGLQVIPSCTNIGIYGNAIWIS